MARKRKQAVDQEQSPEVNMAWDGRVSEAVVAAALAFSTTPALPSRITSLLLRRLEARNRSLGAATSSLSSSKLPVKHHDEVKPSHANDEVMEFSDTYLTGRDEVMEFSDTYFSDFLGELDGYLPVSDMMVNDLYSDTNTEPFIPVNVRCGDYNIVAPCSSGDTNGGTEMEDEEERLDFRFIDELGSACSFSPFEIAQEIASEPINYAEDEEPLTISESMKRMKYERKFSASLYAFHGIPECLRRKLGPERSKMQRTGHPVNEEGKKSMIYEANEMGRVSSSSDVIDGELSLWSSLDLPTICYFN
ncbi:AP2/ERF domain-containing protein [Artemisia annua]|uniref:AP2/ERF domain-containing protein n=1 Tax=Artemisia annua TaxID=35608 RepID=A0A2U1KS76_ARTAN|nr:AP2/ERF domain-containing protein [Artemisia annua]